MVDFETNSRLFGQLEVKVVAASVDDVSTTAELAAGLRLSYVDVLAELDAPAVAASTGAFLQTGDRTFLHATGFIVDPAGEIANAVYSTGPIGRFTANDVLKKILFEHNRRS